LKAADESILYAQLVVDFTHLDTVTKSSWINSAQSSRVLSQRSIQHIDIAISAHTILCEPQER